MIASNINLQKYLPKSHWDAGKHVYLLTNMKNDLSSRLDLVRKSVAKMAYEAASDKARWQESLLVTSIVK